MGEGLKVSVKIEGLNELRKRLQQLPVEMQEKELGNAVAKGAAVVRDEAKARVPVLTGLLRGMIRSTRGVKRSYEAAAFVTVRSLTKRAAKKLGAAARDAFYWRFIEFGTSRMRARPFLRPAFDTHAERAANVIKDELRAGVERQAAKLMQGVKR